MHFEVLTIHAGPNPDPAFGAVMTPIYWSSYERNSLCLNSPITLCRLETRPSSG
jgi:hypothetical protein